VRGFVARHLRCMAILMVVACAASACGRKGPLEPPPSADATKTQADQASTEQQAPGGISSIRAKKAVPVMPKKQPSFLDPILE